jgi:hypothetical protein
VTSFDEMKKVTKSGGGWNHNYITTNFTINGGNRAKLDSLWKSDGEDGKVRDFCRKRCLIWIEVSGKKSDVGDKCMMKSIRE